MGAWLEGVGIVSFGSGGFGNGHDEVQKRILQKNKSRDLFSLVNSTTI